MLQLAAELSTAALQGRGRRAFSCSLWPIDQSSPFSDHTGLTERFFLRTERVLLILTFSYPPAQAKLPNLKEVDVRYTEAW